MNNEFKKISSGNNQTVYVLESATSGVTSSASVASNSVAVGGVQKRRPKDSIIVQDYEKKIEPTKPRNFVAKNAKMGGAGQHKDKKRAEKQGNVKHKNKEQFVDEDHSTVGMNGKPFGMHSYSTASKNTSRWSGQGRDDSMHEAPIEMDPLDPMNPMIYGHGSNPATLKHRMMRATGQLKDLAQRAQTASAVEWETIARQFDELTMNIEQIRHGIDELAKKRKKGGIGSRGIDPYIGEKIVAEGGNVFAGKTASIKRENIDTTLSAYFDELKKIFPNKADIFDETHFVALGSVRKKQESGDIDLGVSVLDILDKSMSDESVATWGVDPKAVAAEFESLKKRARTSTPEQLRMKAFLKLLTISINSRAPNLYCDEKKVTDGNIFGLYPQIDTKGNNLGIGVQIDWMIGDLQWLKFSYHSAAYPEGSNVKGLHRTQLMLSAFQVANLSFNHINGVKDKDTGEVIAKDPAAALQILSDRLGFKITAGDAEDYYKLHKLLKFKMSPEQYDHLLNVYFKILDSTRADIPDDMQKSWLDKKDQLGLTGKFLPDESALRAYL